MEAKFEERSTLVRILTKLSPLRGSVGHWNRFGNLIQKRPCLPSFGDLPKGRSTVMSTRQNPI